MVNCPLHFSHCTFSLALSRGFGLTQAGEKGSAASGGRSSADPNSLPWRGWCGASHGGDGGLQPGVFGAACH